MPIYDTDMKVRDTRAGTLAAFTSLFLGLLAFFSLLDAQAAAQQLWYGVICATFLFWRVRVGQTGVFDTEDGLLVKRMRRSPVSIPTSAEPAMTFEKRLLGHRLVILTNDEGRVATDFLFSKPALERRLELPDNLAAGVSISQE